MQRGGSPAPAAADLIRNDPAMTTKTPSPIALGWRCTAPTFILNSERFRGQDRLAFLDWAPDRLRHSRGG